MIRQTENETFQIEAYAFYQGRRFKKRETFHGTLKQARERESFLRVQLREDCKSRTIKRTEQLKTFGGLIEFCKEHNKFKESMKHYNELIEIDCSNFPIDKLKERFIQYFKLLDKTYSERHNLLANATKNLILRTVKKVINYSVANGILDSNPLVSIKKWKTSPRLVELSREQEKKLLDVCQQEAPHLYPALMFSLRNPIRVGDLCALTRKCLDVDSMTISYTSQKTGVTAVCNIYPELEKYFRNLPPEKECEYLFHYKYNKKYFPLGDFRKSWNKVKEDAGIDKSLRWHDLRHHSCAYLLKQGIPTTSVQKIGGWKSIQMVELYNTGNAIEAARLTREQLLRQIPKPKKKKAKRKTAKVSDARKGKKGVPLSVPSSSGGLPVPQGEGSVVPGANE